MAPKQSSIIGNNNNDNDVDLKRALSDGSPVSADPEARHLLSEAAHVPQEVGLVRQVMLCLGLLASDGGLVLMQLVMLPSLQTLGVPLSLVTLPTCLSGALAMVGLPLLGCLSDKGDNPNGRKTPAVVVAAFVLITGFSLVVSGCGLHTWTSAGGQHQAGDLITSPLQLPASNASSLLLPPTGGNGSEDAAAPSSGLSPSSPLPFPEELVEVTSAPGTSPQQPASGAGMSEEAGPETPEDAAESDSALPSWLADPVGLGIPMAGLLSILGFLFIDMGNDLSNSSQKSFVLASTLPSQHVSLLVVGVQMSAVGGCVAALMGLTDLASYLTQGTPLDTVPGKTLLQCALFVGLTLLCVLTTLLSAPSSSKHQQATPCSGAAAPGKRPRYGTAGEREAESERTSSPCELLLESEALPVAEEALLRSHGPPDRHDEADVSESDSDLSLSCRSETTADTAALLDDGWGHRSGSFRLGQKAGTPASEQESTRAKLFASSSIVYYAMEDAGVGSSSAGRGPRGRSALDAGSPLEAEEEAKGGKGGCAVSKQTRRLVFICTSMFFMCGAWQSFNVCVTDYLGKVIYGGDPEAHPGSRSYLAYQQGMRTASSGVLVLHGVYVVVNFLQKKILSTAGPKVECMVTCGLQVGSLMALMLTDSIAVYYVTSCVLGMFRSVMFTLPFMLANDICQEMARAGDGKANVGSIMALVTTMIPVSNILVSSMTGPLIYSTGDPASPVYYTVAATFIAGVVFVFT